MNMSVSNSPSFSGKWLPRPVYCKSQIERLKNNIKFIEQETDSLYKYGCVDGQLTPDVAQIVRKNEKTIDSLKSKIELFIDELKDFGTKQ